MSVCSAPPAATERKDHGEAERAQAGGSAGEAAVAIAAATARFFNHAVVDLRCDEH
jgi:hypothetical protein